MYIIYIYKYIYMYICILLCTHPGGPFKCCVSSQVFFAWGDRLYHLYGPMSCGSVPGGHKLPTKPLSRCFTWSGNGEFPMNLWP